MCWGKLRGVDSECMCDDRFGGSYGIIWIMWVKVGFVGVCGVVGLG